MSDYATMTSFEARELIRKNKLNKMTSGIARGYVQANLVVVKMDLAFDFLLFCQRNPKPCPVLEVTDIGSSVPKFTAPSADLRTDIGKYRVYKYGEVVDTPTDIASYWGDDMVAFLLGCSYSFENALLNSGIAIRNIEHGKSSSAYITNIPCKKAGPFKGSMVVSMRPILGKYVTKAVQITSRFTSTHGAPVHIGEPSSIGIRDITKPDYGYPVHINKDEVPVFWACGVTPQSIAIQVKPELMITHEPGYMFITDLKDEEVISV